MQIRNQRIPHFKEYRMKMVTSDDSVDVFKAFDEVEREFSGYKYIIFYGIYSIFFRNRFSSNQPDHRMVE